MRRSALGIPYDKDSSESIGSRFVEKLCGWIMLASAIVWAIESWWITYGAAGGEFRRLPEHIRVCQGLAAPLFLALGLLGASLIAGKAKPHI
jgi:hypothetical protein